MGIRDGVDPRELLPLRPLAFEILLTLATGERHGYAMVQELHQRTGRRRLLPGSLYRTLSWMLDQGLAAESSRRPAPDADDARRRYYRITPLGQRTMELEARRLRGLLAEAEALRPARGAGHV